MNGLKIGVLIYTYNRTDDARINMEIIRNVWSKNETLKDVKIIHSFNGENGWWPEKYLEDDLLYLENSGHFGGAEILINAGVKTFEEKYPDLDYIIILASDTWLVIPEYIEKLIVGMKEEEKYLSTSVWGTKKANDIFKKGAGLDFCILDFKWALRSGLFPIGYKEFADKFEDLFFYNDQTIYIEILFMARFLQAIKKTVKLPSENIAKRVAESFVQRMKDREPVHVNGLESFFFKKSSYVRTMYWPKIGLITHHDPITKQRVLKSWNLELGQFGKKFLESKDVSYFNNGVNQHKFVKNGKNINYHD
ncbi:MAG TPA: hypothetical protein VGC58_00690 [Candidatus Paceibacterota bacterium]